MYNGYCFLVKIYTICTIFISLSTRFFLDFLFALEFLYLLPAMKHRQELIKWK